MPFSRSRSIESMTRSATSEPSRKAPDCQSIASTSVVLPWSTWATIATLRMSERACTRRRGGGLRRDLAVVRAAGARQHVDAARPQAVAGGAVAADGQLVEQALLDGVAEPRGDVPGRRVLTARRELVEAQRLARVHERSSESVGARRAPVGRHVPHGDILP